MTFEQKISGSLARAHTEIANLKNENRRLRRVIGRRTAAALVMYAPVLGVIAWMVSYA